MDVVEVQDADVLEEVERFLDFACAADLDGIAGILANGLSVDVVDDAHTTALQIAAAQAVDKCNDCGFTPLLHAARNGKAEVVELLIRHNADPCRTT
ncbi:unnamed protein product [Gongylonema pulchrum]|uniref:ANK_REP_REGION domain-containing protein n=1 Tax=Gongylonema pulchrum TaxID=637853 RepID=A0A183D460_9BILA|nr:unnamed protein product [Gongylonema pulchrum]